MTAADGTVLSDGSAGALATLLPREYYVSQEIFERETERIFLRQWICLGHVSEVPETGDFFRQDLADESVVVVRDGVGRIRGFLNVCRHRGHALCSESKGRMRAFVCPYHKWSYELDGSLRNAPGFMNFETFNAADFALHEVHTEVWNGFVFVWLGTGEVPPLSACLDFDDGEIRRLQPERLKEIFREDYAIGANWKVLLENYLECYHCRHAHPELCVTMDVAATYRNTGNSWRGQYFAGILQLNPGMKTGSMTGELVSRPLGEFAERPAVPDGYGAGIGIVPLLTRIIFHIDHVVLHVMRPLDVSHVRWETRWYVATDAVGGKDYAVNDVTEVWRRTNAEDIALCESAYRGVRSRRYTPGPLNPEREGAIRPALDLYLELMRE